MRKSIYRGKHSPDMGEAMSNENTGEVSTVYFGRWEKADEHTTECSATVVIPGSEERVSVLKLTWQPFFKMYRWTLVCENICVQWCALRSFGKMRHDREDAYRQAESLAWRNLIQ